MKISELTTLFITQYLRIDLCGEDEQTIKELEMIKTAAITYVCEYTGLEVSDLEEKEDITIAVLTLIGDMYDNRQLQMDKQAYVNRTAECILNMHSVNLL